MTEVYIRYGVKLPKSVPCFSFPSGFQHKGSNPYTELRDDAKTRISIWRVYKKDHYYITALCHYQATVTLQSRAQLHEG